jgi:hypothetical protein
VIATRIAGGPSEDTGWAPLAVTIVPIIDDKALSRVVAPTVFFMLSTGGRLIATPPGFDDISPPPILLSRNLHHVSPTGPAFPGHAVMWLCLINLFPAIPGQGEALNPGNNNFVRGRSAVSSRTSPRRRTLHGRQQHQRRREAGW